MLQKSINYKTIGFFLLGFSLSIIFWKVVMKKEIIQQKELILINKKNIVNNAAKIDSIMLILREIKSGVEK